MKAGCKWHLQPTLLWCLLCSITETQGTNRQVCVDTASGRRNETEQALCSASAIGLRPAWAQYTGPRVVSTGTGSCLRA